MIRTRITLSEREYEVVKREAARLGISLAELLRRSLRDILPVDDTKPWMRYAGMVDSGDAQSSTLIDDVVHGETEAAWVRTASRGLHFAESVSAGSRYNEYLTTTRTVLGTTG